MYTLGKKWASSRANVFTACLAMKLLLCSVRFPAIASILFCWIRLFIFGRAFRRCVFDNFILSLLHEKLLDRVKSSWKFPKKKLNYKKRETNIIMDFTCATLGISWTWTSPFLLILSSFPWISDIYSEFVVISWIFGTVQKNHSK